MVDNLMDLTHETYVHATSIGQKEIDEAPVTTRLDGDEVVTSRFMDGIQAPPFWRIALRGAGRPLTLRVAGSMLAQLLLRAMDRADLARIVEIDTKVLGKTRPGYYEMKLEQAQQHSADAQRRPQGVEDEGTTQRALALRSMSYRL